MKYVSYGVIGAAVFLVSAVIGIVAGVRAGTLLFRALSWAIIVGGLSFAAVAALRAFLPEIFSDSSAGSANKDDSPVAATETTGENVDIVVDDEPVANQFVGLVDDGEEEDGEPERRSVARAPSIVPSIVEEVVESAVDADDLQSTQPATGGSDDDSVDELPDIGGFAGGFSETVTGDGSSDEDDEFGDAAGSSMGDLGGGGRSGNAGNAGNDPAAIAKALQTMLKKD